MSDETTETGALILDAREVTITDPDRLRALERTDLLDSPPEEAFDRFTALAAKITHTPVVFVSFLDGSRQFFKSAVGLPEPFASVRETPVEHTICQHVVASGEPLLISDARTHPLVHDSLTVTVLGVVAYAGFPLTTADGRTLGTFCAIDGLPRAWTEEEVGILKDLSVFVMNEVELRLRARQLREDYRRLQELEALRDDLTHMIVHDLRTPLTSLISGMQAVRLLGEMNAPQRECFEIAVGGGHTLLGMINDLLDISKMEYGALALASEEVALADLTGRAARQVLSLAGQDRKEVRWECPSVLPLLVADGGKLERVLVNLIGNALKFSPDGGCVTVSIRPDAEERHLVFSVADRGIGIPEEAFIRIFEKFGQVEVGARDRRPSTGLGLTFCKLVVDAHGGRIWVESEVGAGSTFHFTLPLPAA